MGKYSFLTLTMCLAGCGGATAASDRATSTSEEAPEEPGTGEGSTGRESAGPGLQEQLDEIAGPGGIAGEEFGDLPPGELPGPNDEVEPDVTPESEDIADPVVEPSAEDVDPEVPESLPETAIDPLAPIVDDGGELSWVVSAQGDGHDRSEDVAAFDDGSVVVTGLFGNSKPNIVFGQGEPNETTLTANHSVGDMFIARFNADGSLAFAKNHNLTYPHTRRSIVPLADGSFVISADYWGGTIFGRGEPNQVATPEEENGTFIAKHDANGAIVWVTRVAGAGMPAVAAVSDGFVVTGPFSETVVFGVGSGEETALELIPKEAPPDGQDPLEDPRNHYIAKFDSSGVFQWAKRTGGSYWNEYRDITVLADDSVVLTGTMDDTAVFGAGEAAETALVSAGENDVFVAKYNPDGTLAWATRAGGSGYDGGISLSGMKDGSVVVVGHYTDTAVFGAGQPNETTLDASAGRSFMARFNPDGTLALARTLSGIEVVRAASQDDGTTLVTGTFSDTATFGAGEPNETTLTATERDIFLAKYVPDGRLAWVKHVDGPDIWNEGRGIALTDGAVFIAGYFSEHATFAPGEPNETTVVDHGMDDMFVARYEL